MPAAPHPPSPVLAARRRSRAADIAERAGAFVTLVAIVVLGLMLGSALPGGPEGARSTLTVTYDR